MLLKKKKKDPIKYVIALVLVWCFFSSPPFLLQVCQSKGTTCSIGDVSEFSIYHLISFGHF